MRIPNAVLKVQKPTEEEWLDAHDPEKHQTKETDLLVGKTIESVENAFLYSPNRADGVMTLTFTDGSRLCVAYKAYAPKGKELTLSEGESFV